jgi:predicted dehydrogenase
VIEAYSAVVVGCGRIGSTSSAETSGEGVHSHAQAYVDHPRTRLAAVCDVDPSRSAAASQKWGARAATDAVEICRSVQPHIVSLCTPDDTHYPLARALLEQAPPRALLIEKPLALTSAEGEELLALAARKSCLVAVNYVNYTRRFAPAFRAIADELREGTHGRPLFVRVLYGKGLLHNGSHAIDLLRSWLGEPQRVATGPAEWGPPGDDSVSADLWFDGGARARLDAFDERAATVFELDLLAERSRIALTQGGREWTFHDIADSPHHAGYRTYVPSGRERTDARFQRPLSRALWRAVDNLVAALDGTASLLCSGLDGVAALRWVERIRAGA